MAQLHDPFPSHHVVGVHGYGASGRAATALLCALGKSVVVFDAHYRGTPPQIDGVRFEIGTHAPEAIGVHILSPSLNPEWPENRENPALTELYESFDTDAAQGVSEIELAIRAFDRPIIAVGGTDGKSTTAALTQALGKAFSARSMLGGNSWRALSAVVLEHVDTPVDTAVVEISAFQLHRPHAIRPRVAILTNIAADHLDHYANFQEYVDAKSAMFMHQAAGDTAILGRGDPRVDALATTLQKRGVRVLRFGNAALSADEEGAGETDEGLAVRVGDIAFDVPLETITVLGPHNRRNVMAALLAWVARTGAAPDRDALHRALKDFKGLPHRVRFVREVDGVAYYNDSKATNVHAACVGVTSMTRPTIAIVGGVEKHLALDALWEALALRGKRVVAIGALQERLVREAPSWLVVQRADSMEQAVRVAHGAAAPGDAVLLAPSSASFDMFDSFEHRGDVFEAAVHALVTTEL